MKLIVDTDIKVCTKCNERYPSTDEYFYKQKVNSKKKGVFYRLSSWCKDCSRENGYKYFITNKENHLAQKRKRYAEDENHRSEKLEKQKEIDRNSKDFKKEYLKEWQQENKDKVKLYNEYRSNKLHDITEQEWLDCLEFFNDRCAYCGITEHQHLLEYEQRLHKEHVEHDGANDITNCIPACKGCNSSKHTYELNEWYNDSNPIYSKRRYNKIVKWLMNFAK